MHVGWRRPFTLALAGLLAAACAADVTPPTPTAEVPSPTVTPAPTITPVPSIPPSMDELIAMYDADGIDCEADEYSPESGDFGMVVWCSGIVGDAELMVEAKYGNDGVLDRTNHVLYPVGYPEEGLTVNEADSERGLRLVLGIPYMDAAFEREQVIQALDEPGCIGEDCRFDFDGGHWTLWRPQWGGWHFNLALDGPQG
jgi:hypothetical protein